MDEAVSVVSPGVLASVVHAPGSGLWELCQRICLITTSEGQIWPSLLRYIISEKSTERQTCGPFVSFDASLTLGEELEEGMPDSAT